MSPTLLPAHRISASGETAFGDPSLLFPYWSFTKTVIAALALQLASEGKVALDQRIGGAPHTLRQLLDHTAGLPDYGTLPGYHAAVAADEDPWPRDLLTERTMAQGRLFAPGNGWSYSNLGYMLAREALETAAGADLATLVQERITGPLGLGSVILATTRETFATVCWPGARHYHPGWVYHGCLMGTARDAARLLHGLMTGPLLSDAQRDEMQREHQLGGALPGRPWTTHGYGLGLMIGRAGPAGRVVGHAGGGPFCVNTVSHFPDAAEPVTVACFAEGQGEGRTEFEAVRLALARQHHPDAALTTS
jgi:CubicO group peptidase (beta-lactamase class C family)